MPVFSHMRCTGSTGRADRATPSGMMAFHHTAPMCVAVLAEHARSHAHPRPSTPKSSNTSGPKLRFVGLCIRVLFGTCTTKNAEFWFVVGSRCNRTIGSRSSPTNYIFLKKKLDIFTELDPQKGVFPGVFRISLLCRAKANLHWGRRLGI